MSEVTGKIVRVSGPVVDGEGLRGVKMYEVCRVGNEGLIGEVNRIVGDVCTIQVYEETAGIRPGEPVVATGRPLSVELGPGLIGQIFDGIQRPLPRIKEAVGDFIKRGVVADSLPKNIGWKFTPLLKKGSKVEPGSIIGEIPETTLVKHRIVVPYGLSGELTEVATEDEYKLTDSVAKIRTAYGEEKDLTLLQTWPVRKARPIKFKLATDTPLVTGQRIIDTFFPTAKGGTAAIPGGFGTGKCVTGETPVLMADGDTIRIQELYEKSLEEDNLLLEDSETESLVKLRYPISVLSLDEDRYRPAEATHIYKGTTKTIVEVTTRTGRKLKVTPVHRLFRFNGEIIEETEARNLKVGDYLAVPRKLRIPGRIMTFDPYDISPSLRAVDARALDEMLGILQALKDRMPLKTIAEKLGVSYDVLIGYWTGKNKPTLLFLRRLAEFAGVPRIPVEIVKAQTISKSFRVPKCLTKELAEWLGLFVAEGHLKGTHQGTYLYNTSEEILNRFGELTLSIFGFKARFGQDAIDRTPYAYIRNTPLRKFLHYLGIPKEDKTCSVRIPYCIRVAPEEYLTHFLAGYFAGDGGFYRYSVSFSTASKGLYSDLSYLLARLGVLFHSRTKNGYYLVDVDGESAEHLHRVLTENRVYSYSKLGPLSEYASRQVRHFTGLDVVPIGKQLLSRVIVDCNDQSGYDVFRAKGIRLRNYTALDETPSLNTLRSVGEIIEANKEAGRQTEAEKIMNVLKASEEIYFDRVRKIVVREASSPVFDITVEGTHNFVGGIVPSTFHNTVMLHQLAKWADAKIIVYVGCGERGNEMTEVLEEFPKLKDPRSGEPLMNRTVLIANTSNMPVAAREASIYTGITMAEYFRDMGYDVALMADSTSRWAEALREISGRLEEMPGEEGYPAYLASRLSEFYERAGRVVTLGPEERIASISVTGAVSPPGGDFSEPVTVNTLRIVKVFWALDKDLASRRHFPAINWLQSYSLYLDNLKEWFKTKVSPEWIYLRESAMTLLQREEELKEIVQLVGPDALPESEKVVLEAARMIREDYLMQSALHPVDSYCDPTKSYRLLRVIVKFYENMKKAVSLGVPIREVLKLSVYDEVARLKIVEQSKIKEVFDDVEKRIDSQFESLVSQAPQSAAASK
ncbi:MAG: V-type ATP synthase subunit A [Promethearchaeati archaeon SRVP18_Atabeyarchaeia-1]